MSSKYLDSDYDTWNEKKKKFNKTQTRPMFNEGEIWWCSIGLNIGDEENGKGIDFTRPVLVYKKFNEKILLSIPLSRQLKNNRFYYKFRLHHEEQSLLLSHIRLVDAKRFGIKLGELPETEFLKIKEYIRKFVL